MEALSKIVQDHRDFIERDSLVCGRLEIVERSYRLCNHLIEQPCLAMMMFLLCRSVTDSGLQQTERPGRRPPSATNLQCTLCWLETSAVPTPCSG